MPDDVTGETWDSLFFQAANAATLSPIRALRGEGDGNRESELEIAYRMAEIFAGGPPPLAWIHSCAIQVTLNLARGITPYGHMRRLQEALRDRGFVFREGRIYPPPEREP